MYFADEVARKAYIINYNDNEAYKTIEKWVADENKSQLYMYIGGYGEQENYVPAYISNNNEIAAETTSINNTTGNIKIEQYRYKYTGDDKY